MNLPAQAPRKLLLLPVVNDEPAPTPDIKLLEPVMRSAADLIFSLKPVFRPKKTLSEASLWYPADEPIATEPLVSVLKYPALRPRKILLIPVVLQTPARLP